MSSKTDLQFLLSGSENAIVIREGAALPLKEPLIASLSGVLDSPLRWLEKRIDTIDQKACSLTVDRDKLRLELDIDETNHYGPVVTGSLQWHPMFLKFGINGGKYITHFEMAQLIKMNRTAFENHSVAMNLVTVLQNFKAKVNREIEKADNNRGDKRELLEQVVESNLPEKFNLHMPVFKGTQKRTFEVEVYIKADDFTCTLISPTANDLVEQMRDTEFNDVLERIFILAPDIVIIEQ